VSAPALGVALTAHWLELGAVLRLVRRAEELGYALVLVDGDAALADAKPDRPIYDATALASAAILNTGRARIGAIHFALLWNALLLARSLATLQELAQGRLVALFGVGAERQTSRLGLPQPSPVERVERLDELLDAVRALLEGQTVTRHGRFVTLERAAITIPSAPVPIAVSATGARALEVVRRRADIWDANVPPLRERLAHARDRLGRALPTWCWVFSRPGEPLEAALHDYRRHAPWFRDLSPEQAERAVLYGEPARCRERLERMRDELDLALPIVDLTGLDEARALAALEALAPAAAARIP
jgi:alkanesulfonate monooxygenase SsuD/methylene tetrahydromethanopterin reductase-like flavin-dependent oxidoreductase (luciferase family)